MAKYFILLLFCTLAFSAKGQRAPEPYQPFGIIDAADLKMTDCSFEKEANAEVLFDKAEASFNFAGQVKILHHTRIKIFNLIGKDYANITLRYIKGEEDISDLKAETINLDNNDIKYNPVDEKLVYDKKIDRFHKAIVFTFPNVKKGSVVEFTYTYNTKFHNYLPEWDFQSIIPTRYSQINLTYTTDATYYILHIGAIKKVKQPLTIDTTETIKHNDKVKAVIKTWGMSNITSMHYEPFMTPVAENLQRLIFTSPGLSWSLASYGIMMNDNFGKQLDVKLNKEDALLNAARAAHGIDGQIDTLYYYLKHNINCTNSEGILTDAGVQKAWQQKAGNATEINLMLYHFLVKLGIKAYPVLVNTVPSAYVDPYSFNISKFNKVVVAVQQDDTTKTYVLDVTDKYACYNKIPFGLLHTFCLTIAPDAGKYALTKLLNDEPERQVTFVNADISPSGKITGTVNISSDNYFRAQYLKLYDTLGEEKYKQILTNGDNNLKISNLKRENLLSDTLPLLQSIAFDQQLAGSDENYLYLNTNLFMIFSQNPFIATERYSDVDFKFNGDQVVSEVYTVPPGYKINALPKSVLLRFPDNSITFKRTVTTENNVISVRYVISHQKTNYLQNEYASLRDFYKKMYEMLNEQIVLKKG